MKIFGLSEEAYKPMECFKPKNNIETENIRSELLNMNKDDFNELYNYILNLL